MSFKPLYIFIALCISYLLYTAYIYTMPIYKVQKGKQENTKAGNGKLVWQKFNCQSCHQLYGLGGYLGPDLTNVYSNKGENVIKAMVASGIKAMPAFTLSDAEQNNLIEFLKQVDASGSGDYRNYRVTSFGMIELP
ncbi:MAG: cytochrome c [Bacteroidia bacterium]|nr:cytochrome c [Bacteroidia bacterium]